MGENGVRANLRGSTAAGKGMVHLRLRSVLKFEETVGPAHQRFEVQYRVQLGASAILLVVVQVEWRRPYHRASCAHGILVGSWVSLHRGSVTDHCLRCSLRSRPAARPNTAQATTTRGRSVIVRSAERRRRLDSCGASTRSCRVGSRETDGHGGRIYAGENERENLKLLLAVDCSLAPVRLTVAYRKRS